MSQIVSAKAIKRCPQNCARGVEHKKLWPSHLVDASQHSGPNPQHRKETTEKNNLPAMQMKQVLPNFDATLIQTNVAPVADRRRKPSSRPSQKPTLSPTTAPATAEAITSQMFSCCVVPA